MLLLAVISIRPCSVFFAGGVLGQFKLDRIHLVMPIRVAPLLPCGKANELQQPPPQPFGFLVVADYFYLFL